MAPSVFILLHRAGGDDGTTTVLSVFTDLQDANAQCLARAREAKADPEPRPSLTEPLRWAAADGEAVWVERHTVVPRSALQPPVRPAGLQRKGSNLYNSDEDDAIEVQDCDAKYD